MNWLMDEWKNEWMNKWVKNKELINEWMFQPGKLWNDWISLGISFRETTTDLLFSRFFRHPSMNTILNYQHNQLN